MTDTATVTRSDARVLRRADRRAGRRAAAPGALLAIVLTGQFMAVLDASVVNVAAPSIHTDLHATGAGLQLVIAGYVITYAVGLVTGARLGDILGHRRMFLAGLALFTLASLGCGLAPSTGLLVALRFVQGAGAAAMIPQVLSLIQRSYTGTARARAMRLYAAVIAGGAVAGQILGGLLVTADVFGSTWRSVFLINVPIGAALLILGARWLPHGAADRDRGLDPAGLALLTPAVLALVLPLVLGQPEHWPVWGWACLAGSAVLFALFTLVERRVAARGGAPLIPGRVLRLPGIGLGIAGLFVTMAVFGGFFFVLALHLQGGLGDSPLRAGLTFAPAAAAFALVSLNWQRLPARWFGGLVIAGFAGYAAGPGAAGRAAARRQPRRDGDVLGAGADRRRDGGRVRPADDRGAAPGAGGRGGRRHRGDRHRQPAGPGDRGGHVRHAVPEPGRDAARWRHARRVPAAVRARGDGNLHRPGRGGGGRRRAGRDPRRHHPPGRAVTRQLRR